MPQKARLARQALTHARLTKQLPADPIDLSSVDDALQGVDVETRVEDAIRGTPKPAAVLENTDIPVVADAFCAPR